MDKFRNPFFRFRICLWPKLLQYVTRLSARDSHRIAVGEQYLELLRLYGLKKRPVDEVFAVKPHKLAGGHPVEQAFERQGNHQVCAIGKKTGGVVANAFEPDNLLKINPPAARPKW